MTPEEFRKLGHEFVDWIADYRARLEHLPVRAQVGPGWVRDQLPSTLPKGGESFDNVLADMDRVIVPGTTHWQHPSFFAYFPSNASLASLLGDMLSGGIGTQGMLWSTSPACTELEQHLLDQLAHEMGLPEAFTFGAGGGGVIQDSASSAALVALLAALYRATDGSSRKTGGTGGEVLYVSSQTHSSLEKAAIVAGMGTEAVRVIEADPTTLAMSVSALAAAIEDDIANDKVPAMVCATIGTTSTGAVDPIQEIAALCARHNVWLHIDAAWAGAAAICPELRSPFAGIELADSYCTDGHKWLLTAFDCSLFWTRHTDVLIQALSVLPEYLRNKASDSGAVVDYRDWQVPLGRRFRSLKLWTVLRWFGVEGIRDHVRRHIALATELADWVRADARFSLTPNPNLGLVCFHVNTGAGVEADNLATQSVLEQVNTQGKAFITHTIVHGRYLIRVAIGGLTTEHRHVQALWDELGTYVESELR